MDSPSDYSYTSKTNGPTDGHQDEIVIAVMGCTGTGKSSFIRLITGASGIKIGHSLESETSEIRSVRFVDRGRKVIIVDTPGFDDSRPDITDTDVLKQIADFLLKEYDSKRKLNGIVYLQRISDPRFGGQAARNLRMFQELCGAGSYKNVVILTAFWDRVERKEGRKREQQLKSQFLKDLVAGGARFMRHNRTIEDALEVLQHVYTLAPVTPRIAVEMGVNGKRLEDTAAGSVLRDEIDLIIAKHKDEIAGLKTEIRAIQRSNDALQQALQEERANLQQQLTRRENESLMLKKGLEGERKAREMLAEDVAKERGSRAEWRNKKERNWSAQLDYQAKSHSESLRELQAELVLEKTRRMAEANRVIDSPPPYSRFSAQPRATDDIFEFKYSDQYPPHLKFIPPKHRTGILDIFNFTSLAQTTAMLAIQPDVLCANIRDLAPESRGTMTMQDLVERNRELHAKSRQTARTAILAHLRRDMYISKNIGLRDDWYTDAVFGQQQFTGTNPTTITVAPRRWIDEFMVVARSQGRTDVARLADDPGNLFVQDYSDFRSSIGVSQWAELHTEARYGCAAVALFHFEREGKLHPLAITLDYKEGMEDSVTIFNRRVESAAPADEAEDWPWRYAKMCVQVSDWFRHELVIHLVNTHLVEEVIIVAAYRMFNPDHVVFSLLEPHWNTTLSLNESARSTLVPRIINEMTGFTAQQTYTFLKGAYNRFDWVGSYVPNDLRRRGFPIEDLNAAKYHNYGYARNIARTWSILRKFVSIVLTAAYPGGDSQVANDRFISGFCQEVRSDDGGQLASFPDINTLDELIDFVTMCIHIAAPQHTAVNYLQQYYQTFVPNKPSALYTPLPRSLAQLQNYTEDDVLMALPIHKPRDWLMMAQVPYLLSFEPAEESTILHYATTTADSRSSPKVIRHAAKALKSDLEEFVYTTAKYSKELDDGAKTPYLVLDPGKTAISILI
ncbi:lipoxygenase [Mycena galericulata]|nr:lipoxygenase [Mycena galericulata]